MTLDVQILKNVGLTDAQTSGQTSTVGEPSVANSGKNILLSGNWYASRSLDGGDTWSQISPYTFFPSVDGGFCCDQTVHYDAGRNIFIWILQYVRKDNTNTLRVAINHGAGLGNDDWWWWDFKPVGVNSEWAGEWFDYNHAALSNNYLYVVTNSFSGDTFKRCVVFRFPLDTLRSGASLNYSYYATSKDAFSLRCTQGATDIMYMLCHNTNRQLRLFVWPEDQDLTIKSIDIQPWRAGNYSAPGPDGRNWLQRCDSRITGAWVAKGKIGCMWTANADGDERKLPHIRVVRITEHSLTLFDEPDIWSNNVGFGYPDACPNSRGDVGIVLFLGGANRHPSFIVGIRDDALNSWKLASSVTSTHGPSDLKYGDYLTCRSHTPGGLGWVASGYSLQGGGGRNDVQPQVVHFAPDSVEPSYERWLGV